MYQEERIFQILQALKVKRTLSNQDIMSIFGISRDTARRDIVKLVKEGVAVRTHGGITLPALRSELQTYHSRISQNLEIKRRLVQRAATYLADRALAFLDVSTTVEELCEYIHDNIIVYTHSIYNAERLMGKNCLVNLLGGKLNRRNRFFAGSSTLLQLDGIRFDIAVLGAAAVYEDGVYYTESDDADVKRKVVERSGFVVVVTDDSKFTRGGHHRGAAFSGIDILVTNAMPPKRVADNLSKAGTVLDIIE